VAWAGACRRKTADGKPQMSISASALQFLT